MTSFVVLKIWSHTPSASGSYSRNTSRFQILYALLGYSQSLTKVAIVLLYIRSVTNAFQSIFRVKYVRTYIVRRVIEVCEIWTLCFLC